MLGCMHWGDVVVGSAAAILVQDDRFRGRECCPAWRGYAGEFFVFHISNLFEVVLGAEH